LLSNNFIIYSLRANDWIIKQGEDGDHLYVVDLGKLKCFKKFSGDKEAKYLKTYEAGESFGELALLYNAPRAASIQAETDSILFALDRECFNKIVREAAFKKRERYEKFLMSVELLQSMDPYERVKIADALVAETCEAGTYLMKQVSA
jgi:cAMP-dependent protein kinase regulator